MAQYFPGFNVFGTRDKGEVWNEPKINSSSVHENGLM